VVVSLIIEAISFLGTTLMVKKSVNKALGGIIPVIVSIVLAVGGHFVGMIVSVIVAQEMWRK
jgi:hypothetical protein